MTFPWPMANTHDQQSTDRVSEIFVPFNIHKKDTFNGWVWLSQWERKLKVGPSSAFSRNKTNLVNKKHVPCYLFHWPRGQLSHSGNSKRVEKVVKQKSAPSFSMYWNHLSWQPSGPSQRVMIEKIHQDFTFNNLYKNLVNEKHIWT